MKSPILYGIVIFLTALCLPQPAQANFFDDSGGKWWMNSEQWKEFYDPIHLVSVKDQNDRLEFSFAGAGYWNLRTGGYISKWDISLHRDFKISVNYHFDFTGESSNGQRDYLFDLFDDLKSPIGRGVSVHNSVYNYGSTIKNTNEYSYSYGDDWSWEDLPRSSTDGVLEAYYDSNLDSLQMIAKESNGVIVMTPDLYGLRTQRGVNSLKVFLGGTAGGAPFTGDHSYLSDFQFTQLAVTPEPVSFILFLLGGGVFFGAYFRKKSRCIS